MSLFVWLARKNILLIKKNNFEIMDKKAIMGIVFTALGVAGGVIIASMVQKKMAERKSASAE